MQQQPKKRAKAEKKSIIMGVGAGDDMSVGLRQSNVKSSGKSCLMRSLNKTTTTTQSTSVVGLSPNGSSQYIFQDYQDHFFHFIDMQQIFLFFSY